MFRRSRVTIRPNVCTGGRTPGTLQEAPSSSKDSTEANPKTDAAAAAAVTESKHVDPPPKQIQTAGDGNDQNGEGASSSSAVQRRKRFSVKPKVAPGRLSTLARTPKSPIKPVLLQPCEIPADKEKPTTSTEANSTAPQQDIMSPRECEASDESRLPQIQVKPTISSCPSPESVSPAEGSRKEKHPLENTGKKESSSCGQVKEVSPKAKGPLSIPGREAIELSEKAKTLVSKTGITTSPQHFSLSQLLNDPSDLQRLEKARKLRQLLKQEMHKEKTKNKNKARVKEYSLDPAKMTMRDLIHYLPISNPMLSSLEDSVQENENVIPQSPARAEPAEKAQEPEVQPKILSPRQEETKATAEEEEEVEEEEEDEALMVPQVKVAEDGSLIIDEESLTVEVKRMKGPNLVQERDPIFERGSTTTYSSFRKGTYTKPWSTEETDMFFLAISMVGTDFTMICQLFPHRARSEIKNKFKKEEKGNAWRIDKAFRERRKLDLEYFTKLLEKILEFQKTKKKLKSLSEKNKSPKMRNRKTKGKKATRKLSDVEEENEDEITYSNEEEGEKENENLCNEETPDSKPKKKRKRKNKDDASPEKPVNKKDKKNTKNVQAERETTARKLSDVEEENEDEITYSNEEENENICNEETPDSKPKKKRKMENKDDASPEQPVNKKDKKNKKNVQSERETAPVDISVPANSEEVALHEDRTNLNQCEKVEIPKPAKNTDVKPAKVSHGKESKPLSPLSQKSCKKKKAKSKSITADKEGESTSEGGAVEQIKKKSSPSRQATKSGSDNDSSDQETIVQPTKPSRYGRVPKPIQPLNYSAKEDTHSSASDNPPTSPARHSAVTAAKAKHKSTVKRGRAACQQPAKESKKPKLITLRASQSEYSDEGEEEQREEEETDLLCCNNENSTAAFVPASLCSAPHVVPEVEETMEELSMLAHIPDVLGLCPDASSCERVQNESGTVEPCEHQLDLLVDVIDFLSEHTEASEDESYNEAAQTLLAIGNLSHQSTQIEDAMPEHTSHISIFETSPVTEIDSSSKSPEQQQQEFTQAISEATETDNRPTINTTEEMPASDTADAQIIKPSKEPFSTQKTVSFSKPHSTLEAKSNPSQTRKGRFSKIKPKPNIGCASRTTKPSSQTQVCVTDEGQQVGCDIPTTSFPQPAELSVSESVTTAVFCVESHQQTDSDQSSSFPGTLSDTSSDNKKTCHSTDKPLHSDLGTIDSTSSTSNVAEFQSEQTTNIETVCQGSENPKEDNDISTTFDLCRDLSQEEKNNLSSEQTVEPKTQNAQETHFEPLEEPSIGVKNVHCTEKPEEQEETTPTGNICSFSGPGPDPGNIQLSHETETEYSVSQVKPANVEFVQHQSDISSESSKQSTPQRKRWVPKMKPKPNLVSSLRTTKSRTEVKDNSQCPDQLAKQEKSPQTNLEDSSKSDMSGSTYENDAQLDTLVNVSPKFLKDPSALPSEESMSGINLIENTVDTELAACSEIHTNTRSVKSTAETTKLPHPHKTPEDHSAVQQHSGLSQTDQGKDQCQITECAPSNSTKLSERELITPKPNLQQCSPSLKPRDTTDSDICPESHISSDLQIAASEFSVDDLKLVESDAKHSIELPRNDAGPPLSCLDQERDISMQSTSMTSTASTFEYPSLIFPNMLSEQVPSDPDEPFFILSLTEIPVCPSGEVVPPPDPVAQQSNPVEHVVPVTAGVDDSLSNIHLSTPEKAGLDLDLTSLEDTDPSAADGGRPEELQESTSSPPLNLSEVEENIKKDNTLPTMKIQPSVRGNIEVKPSALRKSQVRKTAAKEANKQAQTDTTQEPPALSAPTETFEATGKMGENKQETESDGDNVASKKMRKKTACSDKMQCQSAQTRGEKRPIRKTKASSDLPCGQKSSQPEGQYPEESISNDAASSSSLQVSQSTSSTIAPSVDPSQQDTTETRGKRSSKGKNKASSDVACSRGASSRIKCKSSQSQRKSPVALQSQDAPSLDSLQETHSPSTMAPSQTQVDIQQSISQNTEFPESEQSDLMGSSFLDEEPTNVSQYFLSDIFTEVEEECKP